MRRPSELELYLRNQQGEGRSRSEGRFTISREEALAKLSTYQLPFDGAWVVKLVQAGVAHDGFRDLGFSIDEKNSTFQARGDCPWSLNQIEEALLDPNCSRDRGLSHLVTALRVVGFGEKRAFWIELAEDEERMVWDGQRLSRTHSGHRGSNFQIVVSNRSLDDEGGFFGLTNRITAVARNAAACQNLYNKCHTCPKRLYLDGSQIDGLEMNPSHGWGAMSQLLAIGFQDGALPLLSVPPRTTARTVCSKVPVDGPLSEITEEHRKAEVGRTTCGIAYLVSAHLAPNVEGSNRLWTERSGQSQLHWVQDGVLIDSEAYGIDPDVCSVGCFLSAEGLETDLSGFQLRGNPEKERRKQESRKLLKESLKSVQEIDFGVMARKSNVAAKGVGALFAAVGLGSFFLFPLQGALFMSVGLYSYFSASDAGSQRADRFTKALKQLNKQL